MLDGYLSRPWELLGGLTAMPNEQSPAMESDKPKICFNIWDEQEKLPHQLHIKQ